MSDDAEISLQFSRAAPVAWFDKHILDRSLMICRMTHSPFSHVDLVLDEELKPAQLRFPVGALLGASDNPSAPVIAGNPRGVAIRHSDYQFFAVRRVARMACSHAVKANFTQFCMNQLGKPFDTQALKAKHFLSYDFSSRDWRDNRRWYCAEMMACAAEASGLLPWKLVCYKNRISPADLLLIINPLIDVDEFYQPIPDLRLGDYEQEEIK